MKSSTKTVEGRFQKDKTLCDRMMNFMCVMGEVEFGEKYDQLESLLDSWTNNSLTQEALVNDTVESTRVSENEPITSHLVSESDPDTVLVFKLSLVH